MAQPVLSAAAQRRFYLIGGGLMLLTVFGGFARTYFLKSLGDSPPLGGLLHLHGLCFSAWMILFVTQSALITGRHLSLHRSLGYGGAVLTVLMVVLGVMVSIGQLRHSQPAPGFDPRAFLAVPLFALGVFAVNVAGGVWWRRDPAAHKRLMFIATTAMLDPAIARLPLDLLAWHPLVSSTLADLFWVALAVFDWKRLRRLHWATVAGGAVLCASQPLALVLGETGPWLRFAEWLAK